MNEEADWFMVQSPLFLGKIHNELHQYKELPIGIGQNFFRYMTLESATKYLSALFPPHMCKGERKAAEYNLYFVVVIGDTQISMWCVSCEVI